MSAPLEAPAQIEPAAPTKPPAQPEASAQGDVSAPLEAPVPEREADVPPASRQRNFLPVIVAGFLLLAVLATAAGIWAYFSHRESEAPPPDVPVSVPPAPEGTRTPAPETLPEPLPEIPLEAAPAPEALPEPAPPPETKEAVPPQKAAPPVRKRPSRRARKDEDNKDSLGEENDEFGITAPPADHPQERRRAEREAPRSPSCAGLRGFPALICNTEGPAHFWRCAPDGVNWDNEIPGCQRSSGGNRNFPY
ncbi:MAG: hypothetical protein LBO00_04700 [Zoogloeaceae bacterium]|nr:hypothetical protein [Zoogloeaceae bacterium]